jgi:hypothetical protein
MNEELEEIWKEAVVAQLEVLCRRVSERTGEPRECLSEIRNLNLQNSR